MDGIQRVVGDIVQECRAKAVECSDTLAAFMARAVILDRPERFTPDKPLNDDDIKALIDICVTRLGEQDSPALETVRMQVAYDSTYFQQGEEIGKTQAAQDRHLEDIMNEIVSLKTRGDSDFEGLTELYRRIFIYLVVHSGMEGFEDRALEREIVAALESVFPRVGLRTFVTLVEEDKVTQVRELASIVFGIRLFNREIGKGGTGIGDVVGNLRSSLTSLEETLTEQHQKLTSLCSDYTLTINFMHRQKDSKGAPTRLRDELTNRRQYLACLHNLQEDSTTLRQRADGSLGTYQQVLEELRSIVGQRSSVPKEQVYPKFDRLAKVWKEMEEDKAQVTARLQVLETLITFRQSFHSRLRAHDVAAARTSLESDAELAEVVSAENEAMKEMSEPAPPPMNPEADFGGSPGSLSGAPPAAIPEDGELPPGGGAAAAEPGAPGGKGGPGGAVLHLYDAWRQRHSVGQLALGRFCPWTVAKRDSLLLFGRPPHGIIEFKGQFFACASVEALQDAMKGMESILEKVYMFARRSPELIHLLQLGNVFPSASLPAIVEASVGSAGGDGMTMCDSDCQTPTHFQESNIDPKYEWNEWALRRRGLQLANLRGKRTHSTQTATSHFRRENETQVYEHKEKESNTNKDAKTQAPKMVSYMTGLRGRPTKTFTVVGMTLE